MKNVLTLLLAFVLFGGAAFAQTTAKTTQTAATDNNLVAQLPASEAVMTMNLKRLLSEVVPQMLAGDPATLNKINGGIEEFKAKSGVDLRQFEQAAVSLNYKQPRAGEFELEPTLLVRGSFNSAALVSAGKIVANGKFRQEQIAGKNVVIFTIPEMVKKPGSATQPVEKRDTIERMFDKLTTGEVAVVVVDQGTLAIGKPAQVRSLLSTAGNNRVAKDFTDHFNRNPRAVMNFAGNVPAGIAGTIEVGNDQIAEVLGTLQKIFASVDANGGNATVALTAQTFNATQAEELSGTLQFLQSVGKGFLGGKADAKNQALTRIVENLKISQNSNQVQLDTVLTPEIIGVLIK